MGFFYFYFYFILFFFLKKELTSIFVVLTDTVFEKKNQTGQFNRLNQELNMEPIR